MGGDGRMGWGRVGGLDGVMGREQQRVSGTWTDLPNHWSMHSAWKTCKHGSTRTTSSASSLPMHTEQSPP
eukprot:scaffold3596_cov90-Isochrysis_galbana.AAC.2